METVLRFDFSLYFQFSLGPEGDSWGGDLGAYS